MIEEVIELGTRPVIPKLDLAELASSAPSKFIKPVATRVDQEEDEEDHSLLDESESSTKPSGKKSAAVKKPQKLFTMSTEGEENPLYHIEMVVFDTELKELTNARLKKVNLISTQLEHFYQIIWNQCGLSMQLFIKNIKAWKTKHKEKDSVWLYLALQAIGVGTVSVNSAQAMTKTLTMF